MVAQHKLHPIEYSTVSEIIFQKLQLYTVVAEEMASYHSIYHAVSFGSRQVVHQ